MRVLRWLLITLACLLGPNSHVRGATPPNDYFTNAITLNGFPAYFSGSIIDAKSESGEPAYGGPARQSVWWNWTAPGAGTAGIILSNIGFAPLVKVFSGIEIRGLTNIVQGMCCNNSYYVTWSAIAGARYHLSIDSGGNPGEFSGVLTFTPLRPINDSFNSRFVLSMTNLVTPSNVVWMAEESSLDTFATREVGEPPAVYPLELGSTAGQTLWWSWSAPLSGAASLRITSATPIVGSLYKGLSLTSLTQIAQAPNSVSPGIQEFNLRVGKFQRIEIVTDRLVPIDSGLVTVQVSLLPSPVNDDFSGRLMVTGLPAVLTGRLEAATVEPGEPFPGPIDEQRQSIWWAWTAPSTGNTTLSLTAAGGLGAPRFAVYKGNTLAQLEMLTNGGGDTAGTNAEFRAEQGITYAITLSTSTTVGMPVSLAITRGSVPEIAWSQPTADVVVPAGIDLPLEVTAFDVEGPIARVEFFLDGRWIVTDVEPPYSTVLTNVAAGIHVVSARAFDLDAQSTAVSRSISARPRNDSFGRRTAVSGLPVLVRGTTAGATHETGEPLPSGAGQGSVWWAWTPIQSGPVVIAAAGTNVTLLLSAYTNDILGELRMLGSSMTGSINSMLAASLITEAVAGVPIQIAVDSTAIAGLSFELTVRPLPPNDRFTDRTQVNGSQFSLVGYNHGATPEPGEPPHSSPPSNTVWWTWSAPFTHTLRVDITNNFRSTVAIYSGPGSNITNLVRLAAISVPTRGTTYSLPVLSGATYHFAVDGQFGWTGDIRVTGRPDGVPVIEKIDQTPTTLRIRFRGIPGRIHRVDSSSDFQSWLPGQSILLSGDLGEFNLPLPPASGEARATFFRLTLP